MLSPSLTSSYPKVTLSKNHVNDDRNIHRLLAKYFIPNPDNKPYVLHRDDDRLNYNLDNLYWGDQSQNVFDAINNGKTNIPRGESSGASKLSKKNVLEIRAAYDIGCFTYKEVAEAYNVGVPCIWKIINRKMWRHI